MPITCFCKKCKADVRPGETCPRCGSKLGKASERISFGGDHVPVTDWFSWNVILRVVVSVLGVVLLATLILEGVTEGMAGIQAIFVQGLFWLLMGVLGVFLLFSFLWLLLQGKEEVHCVLDAKGVHTYTLLAKPKPWQLYIRLLTPQTVQAMQADAPIAIDTNMMYVKHTDLTWAQVARVGFWPETGTLLFFHPTWWQALYIRCDEATYPEAEAYVRKRLSRRLKVLGSQKRK